jgi:hypothetical protein
MWVCDMFQMTKLSHIEGFEHDMCYMFDLLCEFITAGYGLYLKYYSEQSICNLPQLSLLRSLNLFRP